MASIADLVINIEADSSGLETQLKKGMTTVSSWVDKMNSMEVNWQSILAGALDTSIISGIAATFALAIEQTVQFQQATLNMNNVATPATQAFADSINQIGGQAYQLAQSSGQSLGDATSAFEAFSKAGLDSAAATTAVNEASQIAYATGQSFTDVVTELVGLFQQWGVTSAPQVTQALTGLANAAQNGKFTFDQLVNAMTPQGAFLSTKTNISDTAISLAELSTKSGLTTTAILDNFNTIATAASQGLANPINNLVGSMSTYISSGPDGLITAFSKIGAFINQSGPSMAGVWGNALGLMAADTASFENTSSTSFANTVTAADTLRTHLSSLQEITDANTTEVGKLTKDWNDFKTAISQFIVPAGIKALEVILEDMTASIDLINGFFAKAPNLFNGSIPNTSGNVAGSTPSGGLNVNSILNNPSLANNAPSAQTQLAIDSLGNSIGASIASFLTKYNSTAPVSSGSQNSTSFNNTFNVNGNQAPALTAQTINAMNYNQFVGTQ